MSTVGLFHAKDGRWSRFGETPVSDGTVLWEGGAEVGVVPPWSSTDFVGGSTDPNNQYYDVQMDGNTIALNNQPKTVEFSGVNLRNARSTKAIYIVAAGTNSTGTLEGTKRVQFRANFPRFKATTNGNDNELWAGFSFFLGAGYNVTDLTASKFHNIWGWRQFGIDGASFYLTIESEDGGLVLRRSTGGAGYQDGNTPDQMYVGPVEVNKWIDIIVHSKLSTTNTNAWRQVWVNGATLGGQSTANVATTTDDLWMRIGPYMNTAYAADRHIWYDNVRIGTSYNAVDPARTT